MSAAYRVGFAFADAKALEKEQHAWEARLGVDLRTIEDAAIEAELNGNAARGALTATEEQTLAAILTAMFGNSGATTAAPTEEH